MGDNNEFKNRSSGAYIFRPNGTLHKITDKADFKVYNGNLVAELHQKFNDYVNQITRVNLMDNFVEFDWIVGPIPTRYLYN